VTPPPVLCTFSQSELVLRGLASWTLLFPVSGFVLTWYPQINLETAPMPLHWWSPTSPLLAVTPFALCNRSWSVDVTPRDLGGP